MNPIPALIERRGVIHFSLIGKDGFNLICPVTSNAVTSISKPTKDLSEKELRALRVKADDYILLAAGATVEATLRRSGQWSSVLTLMSSQMEHAVATRYAAGRREKPDAMPRYWS